MKKHFRLTDSQDVQRVGVGLIAAVLFGLGWNGLDLGRVVTMAIAAGGAANTVWGMLLNPPPKKYDDETNAADSAPTALPPGPPSDD